MSAKPVIQVGLDVPLRTLFDYWFPEGNDSNIFSPGIRLRVPFGAREMIGICFNQLNQSYLPIHQMKAALEVLDAEPVLLPDILRLVQFTAEYYHHPIGEVCAHALPKALRLGKPLLNPDQLKMAGAKQPQAALILNEEQQQVFEQILQALHSFEVFLLQGITGSGKTEIYLQLIDTVLQQGQQALVLVPEIALTPQTLQRFQDRFSVPVVAYHSGLTEKKRLEHFSALYHAEAKIVVGTRSAIFLPLPQLGLIVVDEEHDGSYKQQEGLRYHARDLAIMRASFRQVPIVLGSATPSLESMQRAQQGRYRQLELSKRSGFACLPSFQVVDANQEKLQEGLSETLVTKMKEHLARDEQVLLFLNRRGFAPMMFCGHCRFYMKCRQCSVPVVYHQHKHSVMCHHCGSEYKIPSVCPDCQQSTLEPIGLGTERIEHVLAERFPEVNVLRIDRDTMRHKQSWQDKLAQINQGQAQILIGTQMLAKGHHFPRVTLVGIIDIDYGFLSIDFRATERMGQLLLQVAGRAGRAELPGHVILQTRFPDHPLLSPLIEQDYAEFAQQLLIQRQKASLPPYTYAALVRMEHRNLNKVKMVLRALKQNIVALKLSGLEVLGPAPALIEMKAKRHRYQLYVQSQNRTLLHHAIARIEACLEENKSWKSIKLNIDVDPLDMF